MRCRRITLGCVISKWILKTERIIRSFSPTYSVFGGVGKVKDTIKRRVRVNEMRCRRKLPLCNYLFLYKRIVEREIHISLRQSNLFVNLNLPSSISTMHKFKTIDVNVPRCTKFAPQLLYIVLISRISDTTNKNPSRIGVRCANFEVYIFFAPGEFM